MAPSLSQILRYPFHSEGTRARFWILLLLSLIPFVGSVLIGPFATAAVSVITIEKNEAALLSSGLLITRAFRAFLAGLITLLYLLPALGILVWMGFSFWQGEKITWPAIFLFLYGLLVVGSLPFAVLHAVTRQKVWAALALPKLIWINLKIHLSAFLKLLVLSCVIFGLKLLLTLLGPVGDGLLGPLKAYSEYTFQYLLAVSYLDVVEEL